MPRGNQRLRKEPITDDWIWESIKRGGGLGNHHPRTGHYATLTMRCDNADEAAEYRRSLFRCAYYLARTGQAPVSVFMEPVERAGGKFVFDFTIVDKSYARSHHLAKRGKDRSKWPYDPIMRRSPE
jgi:hypothetical protein